MSYERQQDFAPLIIVPSQITLLTPLIMLLPLLMISPSNELASNPPLYKHLCGQENDYSYSGWRRYLMNRRNDRLDGEESNKVRDNYWTSQMDEVLQGAEWERSMVRWMRFHSSDCFHSKQVRISQQGHKHPRRSCN